MRITGSTPKGILTLVEVALFVALYWYIRALLANSAFADWQTSVFGARLASGSLLFFVLPLTFVLVGGRDPGSCAITNTDIRYHLRVAARAAVFLLPATALFSVVAPLGTTPMAWGGAAILAAGFAAAGLLFASKSHHLPNRARATLGWKGLPAYVALLLIGMIISFFLHPISPVAARVVAVFIFVGFLEEFLFRGYIQSRLNDGLGKPFRFHGVDFGVGLILAALIFGAFHPLSVASDASWAWALWTTVYGLVLGFVREKTGSVVAPALIHGITWLPGVFFGAG
jgi:membrane protease YdiL (CAAX protease family)